MRENDLMIIEKCIENQNEKLDVKEEPFEKLMFFYKSALKQLELQMNIIKDEFKLIYNYDLIDHINTRIKEPKSIVKKMEKKKYDKTYLNLIEKINDIAGIYNRLPYFQGKRGLSLFGEAFQRTSARILCRSEEICLLFGFS